MGHIASMAARIIGVSIVDSNNKKVRKERDNTRLIGKLLFLSKQFDTFKMAKDINNMFVTLYKMRIVQGKMSLKLYRMEKRTNKHYIKNVVNGKDNEFMKAVSMEKEFYDVSILKV